MAKKKEMPKIYVPENHAIEEHGYFNINEISALLRKYKNNPEAVQFLADMLEE